MTRIKLFLTMAAAVAVGVRADESVTTAVARLTLEQCLEQGLEKSLTVARIREDQAVAVSRAIQARADALPHLTANGNYNRLDELQEVDLNGQTVALGTLDNYSVDVVVKQTLYSGGRVLAALRAAKLYREYTDHSGEERASLLVHDIRLAFYNLLLAAENVEVRLASVTEAEALVDQTEAHYKSGTVPELDVLSARVRLSNEKPLLIQARGGLDMAREALVRLIQFDGPSLDVDGELSYRRLDALPKRYEALAMAGRAQLRALRTEVALRKEDISNARADRRPHLSAQASMTGANSYGFVGFNDDWQWHWNAGVVLSWNVWDGGLTAGIISEKEHAARGSALALADVEDQVKLQVRQVCVDLRSADERVRSGRGGVELGTRALSQAQTRYRAGVATTLDVIAASQALAQARLNYQLALRDHMAAVARLAFACGVTVEDLYPVDAVPVKEVE